MTAHMQQFTISKVPDLRADVTIADFGWSPQVTKETVHEAEGDQQILIAPL